MWGNCAKHVRQNVHFFARKDKNWAKRCSHFSCVGLFRTFSAPLHIRSKMNGPRNITRIFWRKGISPETLHGLATSLHQSKLFMKYSPNTSIMTNIDWHVANILTHILHTKDNSYFSTLRRNWLKEFINYVCLWVEMLVCVQVSKICIYVMFWCVKLS